MSLVNDMLRDLDQRRKDSESSSAPIRLTPANEIPTASSGNRWLFVTIAIAIVAAGLIYYWIDSNSRQGELPLNIRPEIALSNSEELDQSNNPIADESDAELIELEGNTISVAPVTTNELPENEEIAAVTDDLQSGANDTEQTPASSSDPIPLINEESAVTLADSVAAEPVSQNPQETNNQEAATDSVEVVDVESDESIKDVAQLTAEEEDTLAVQEALRLIADNRLTEAYAHLEGHVLNNRYAHQSRETYAKLLMNQGELHAAYNLVESGLAMTANHSGYKKIKARILLMDSQIDSAVDLLLSRAPDISTDPEYHDLLATAQLMAQDYEGASISYRSLVQFDQGEGKYWYGFAASQDSMGNAVAARQAYTQAMQLSNLSANLRRRSQERLAFLSQ